MRLKLRNYSWVKSMQLKKWINYYILALLPIIIKITSSHESAWKVLLVVFFSSVIARELIRPKWAMMTLKLILLLGSILYIGITWKTIRDIAPATFLFLTLLQLKLLELESRRDILNFGGIFILALAGTTLGIEKVLSAFLVIFALSFMLYVFFRTQLKLILQFGGRFRFMLALGLSVVLVLLFVLFFPRVNLGKFMALKNSPKSGISRSISPGEVGEISLSSETNFRFRWMGSEMKMADSLYWRVVTLEAHAGGMNFRWLENPLSATRAGQRKGIKYEVTLLSDAEKGIPVIDGVGSILSSSSFTFQKKEDETYTLEKNLLGQIRYTGEVSNRPMVAAVRGRHLKVKVKDREVLALAKKLKGPSAKESVVNLANYFSNQNFRYTLSPGRYERSGELKDFLLKRQLGFCEHYAAAATVLLRLMQIPARVVVGFLGASQNKFADFFQVSGKHAHAWVEYHDGPKGWKKFDPVEFVAPGRLSLNANDFINESLLANKENGFWKFGKELFSLAEFVSYEFLYNFGLEEQLNLLKHLFANQQFDYGHLIAFFMLGMILSLMTYFVAISRCKGRKKSKVDRLFAHYLEKKKKEGFEYSAHLGPMKNFDNLLKSGPSNERDEKIFNLYTKLTYGPPVERGDWSEFKNLVRHQ